MEESYWELFCKTGNPAMYMKFKETESGHGTDQDNGYRSADSERQEQ